MAGTRKIAADLGCGYRWLQRLAGADEDRTLSRLRGLLTDLIDPLVLAISQSSLDFPRGQTCNRSAGNPRE